MELTGFVKETVRGISKTDCEELCLNQNSYFCKSASYDYLRQECHLSNENRFTKWNAFLTKNGIDYLENQCIPNFRYVLPNYQNETITKTTITRKTATTTVTSNSSTLATTSPARE